MMKHVQLSPYRSRADTVSLSSNASFSSLSPEPLGSRSSSYSSLSDASPHTTIKVYARCLRPDIEYKTLSITFQTTCREVVDTLLSKYRMKHRDPRLFYLSMEVTVRKAGVRTQIALDEEAKPAVLQSCHPKGDSRFSLQTRRGGLVKVYDSALNSNSQYKSLLISARTSSDELIALLLTCCGSTERVEQFSLYEVCPAREQQRKLHPDDRPLLVQQTWQSANACHFLIRRNPDYRPLTRRKFPVMWTPDLTTVPCASKLPPIMSHTKIRALAQNKKEDDRDKSKSSQNVYNIKPPTSEETKTKETKSSSTTKILGSSSYADYENYFYI
ncbi:rau [Carabus blaptoides fortunei]